ncbi:MAG: hypothetical protein QM647_13070 [Asticcacaulis sp.]
MTPQYPFDCPLEFRAKPRSRWPYIATAAAIALIAGAFIIMGVQ